MLFTELNTDVLLHIYECLDPIDSINLAETCSRLRDVAQLHYKRFKIFNLEHFFYNETNGVNRRRHNRIDATTVLKHIGPFIRDLAADLDMNKIGSDVSSSIRKYCVNVKALNIIGRFYGQVYDYTLYDTAYFDWLRKLNLTKISLPIRDLFLIDLSKTTTLHELYIHYHSYHENSSVDYDRVADIFERNVNISCLRIQLESDLKYEIFEKLKFLKRLVLDISGGYLVNLTAHLKMTALEKVELNYISRWHTVYGVNEFIQKLSENASRLKHFSIANHCEMVNAYPLSSLHLLNLTSLRWIDKHPNLYKEIPKMQPNLTHVDLMIHDVSNLGGGETLPKPMEQIIFLIENLEKLELLHIRFRKETNISSTLKDFLQEPVLSRLFDCHSIDRPTVTLRLIEKWVSCRFVQVKLDFGARKWTWTTMKAAHFKGFVENSSQLPFFDSYVETIEDLLAVQRFTGTASDLNAVKDEANKWIERLSWKE